MKQHNRPGRSPNAARLAVPARLAAALVAVLLLAAASGAQGPTLTPSESQAGPSSGPSLPAVMSGAIGKLLQSAGSNAESLPAPSGSPAANQPAPGRQSFTIPLAESPDQSAVRVGDDNGLISLAVRDAPLRHVLAMIADARNLNLVFASSTDVPVTATLDRVPIEQALDSLLSASGYTWARNGDVIFVTSLAAAEALPPGVQGRRVAVLELDFASAADIDQAVKGLLSPVGKSWVTETSNSDNRRTAETIVVEDLAPYVARIEEYVSQVDQPPRQVLIEAHILEVDLSRDKRAGVDLQAITRASGASISLRSPGLANPNASPGFILEATGGDLSPVIEALITTTDAKTLAAPRVLAVNGQESRIQIGEQLGFRVTTTTETSTLESVEFLDVGVVLTVTPRITRDGRVLMRIKPEVSSGNVNPDTGLPEEETTELETDILLGSGQGMVIGGLIQERDTTNINKVPLLGSIPYAGFFFQRRQVVKSRSEIIVALVPHVMPYEPVQLARNAHEVDRAFTPLTYGPLCRYPRPDEPRLVDVIEENPPWACQHDEPCCGPPTAPVWATLRRLPPVLDEDDPAPCEACETPTPEVARWPYQQPRVTGRPGPQRR